MEYPDIDIEIIQLMKKKALLKYIENKKLREEKKKVYEGLFLKQLKNTSDDFINKIISKSIEELQNCSELGYLQKKFFFENFKTKFGPVRLSTLVKGFKINDEWNAEIFEKIGYKAGTPFDKAVSLLKEKGILLEDISDLSKGLGFWLKVSFLDGQ